MEGKVALETGMDNGKMFVVINLEGRIDSLHAEVEADDEIVEVEAETHAITDSHVFQDATELLQVYHSNKA